MHLRCARGQVGNLNQRAGACQGFLSREIITQPVPEQMVSRNTCVTRLRRFATITDVKVHYKEILDFLAGDTGILFDGGQTTTLLYVLGNTEGIAM